jgi:hypothetical protein
MGKYYKKNQKALKTRFSTLINDEQNLITLVFQRKCTIINHHRCFFYFIDCSRE